MGGLWKKMNVPENKKKDHRAGKVNPGRKVRAF